jgi:26S proteasome regulatory subunit N6
MAEIDLMSGILYAQDQDYKTAYSYFYETLEPLMYNIIIFSAGKDPRAINCFKYMILCKIMSNNKDDVNNLINGKFGLKYSGDSNITAMKLTADAHFKSSLIDLIKVLRDYKR